MLRKAVLPLLLAAAAVAPSVAGASAISLYPLPTYSVSGTTYQNELIDAFAVAGGKLWWTGTVGDRIGWLDPRTAAAGTSQGEGLVQLSNTMGTNSGGAATGPDGDLYFGLWNDAGIWKLDPTQSPPTPTRVLDAYTKGNQNDESPRTLAFAPDGDLFFSTIGETLDRAAASSGYSDIASRPTVGDPVLFGVTTDAANDVWGAESGSQGGHGVGAIAEQTPGSTSLVEYPVPYAGSAPDNIVVGHDGTVWFTDSANNAIGRLVPSQASAGTGNGITEFPIPVPAGATAAKVRPFSITAAADGSIWFSEEDTSYSSSTPPGNQIGELTPLSASQVSIVMQPTPDHEQPTAIYGDGAGNVWYAGSDDIGEVTGATGAGTTTGGGATGGGGTTTGGGGGTTTTSPSSPTTSTAVVETVTTSGGHQVVITTAPGQAGYAALDQHLIGGLTADDIAKLLANGGFSIQIPLTYPAYAGEYSASGSASPAGIPGYDGNGVDGGSFAGTEDAARFADAKAKRATPKPVVLFRFSHRYAKTGTYAAKVRFTKAGTRLLRAAQKAHKRLKVAVSLSLTAKGHVAVHHRLAVTLKPGRAAKHRVAAR